MASFSDLNDLNAQIEKKGAYVGILLESATNVYTKSIGEFIIGVLEIQYLATEVDNLISIFIEEARRLPSVTVPQYYTTYIYYIKDVIRKCKQAVSISIPNPELMLLNPQKMLERAQQTMYNLLPPVPYEYRHGEMGVPIEHYTACNNSMYNNDYANLAIYARKAADDIATIPNVLKQLNEQRDAETIARNNARIAAETAQADVLRQRIEEYRTEQERLATTRAAQERIIAGRMERANLNNISMNPFNALGIQRKTLEELQMEARAEAIRVARAAARAPSAQAAYQSAVSRAAADARNEEEHAARRAERLAAARVSTDVARVDDRAFRDERLPFFVDKEFSKSKDEKIAELKKILDRMNGKRPLSDDKLTAKQIEAGWKHETINIKAAMNKIVTDLGSTVENAILYTKELVEKGNIDTDADKWAAHSKSMLQMVQTGILSEDSVVNAISAVNENFYVFSMASLLEASKLITYSPDTPMGGQHKIARKQNFTKKQSKKHNITKNKKNRKK
jgi:hypothetical protein